MKLGLLATIFLMSSLLVVSFVNSASPLSLITGFFTFLVNSNTSTISCSNCNTGTCSCTASGCDTGYVDYYSSSNCYYVPYKEGTFSNGGFSIPISGTLYLKIYCDNGGLSSCQTLTYTGVQTTTTAAAQQSGGPSCLLEGRVCPIHTPCCAGLSCQNGLCTKITTTTTTTAEISKIVCPYECCINEPNYYDKYCGEDTACMNHVCENTLTETAAAPEGPKIDFSLVASAIVSIGLIIFLIYFVFARVIGRRAARTFSEKTTKERTIPS